jgi:hypothetical protein
MSVRPDRWGVSNPAQPWTITVVIIIVAIYCHAADAVSTWADAVAITASLRRQGVQQRQRATLPTANVRVRLARAGSLNRGAGLWGSICL